MVQILLMLDVLFTKDTNVEDLFCGAPPCSEPSLFFSNYLFSLGFKPIQDEFQHNFALLTDEADSSVVLTSCRLRRLESVLINTLVHGIGRSTVLQILLHIFLKHQSQSPRLLEHVLMVYLQLRQTSPFSMMLLQPQISHEGTIVDLLLRVQNRIVTATLMVIWF